MTGLSERALLTISLIGNWYVFIFLLLVLAFLIYDRRHAGNGLSNALIWIFAALAFDRVWNIATAAMRSWLPYSVYQDQYFLFVIEWRGVTHIVSGIAITYFFVVLTQRFYRQLKECVKHAIISQDRSRGEPKA